MKLGSIAATLAILSATTTAWSQEVTLRLGHAVFESHPNHDTAVRFKEAVERLSDDEIQIQIFPSRQLGDVKELMEGVELGTVDLTVNSSSALATMIPSVNAFQLPGVIADYEEFAALSVSKPARDIMDQIRSHGMLALGLYDGGQRHFMTIGEPVDSLQAMSGLKTRVAPVPLFIDVWSALGTNPTPMAYGEVYSALETGALDAVEINLSSIESEKFYEVAGGVSLTGHYFWPSFLLVNQMTFEGLSPDQQAILRDAASEIVGPQVMAVAELDEQIKATLEERDIPVVVPSDAFMEEMRAAYAPVVQTYRDMDPLIDAFVAEATAND